MRIDGFLLSPMSTSAGYGYVSKICLYDLFMFVVILNVTFTLEFYSLFFHVSCMYM